MSRSEDRRPVATAAPEIFQLFDPIFHGAREGVLLTQPSGTVLRANPAARVALGRTEDELRRLGRDGLIVTDSEAMRLVEKRQRTGQVVGELRFRRPDGSTFQAEFTSSILPSGSSASLAIVIFRDVTEERAVTSALEESRIRLAFALEASELGSWDWIVGEPVVTINRRCMHILGIPMADEETVYSIASWMGAIHPEDAPRVIAATEDLSRGRIERYDLEYRLAVRGGPWKAVRVQALAVARNPDGTARRVAGTLADRTNVVAEPQPRG